MTLDRLDLIDDRDSVTRLAENLVADTEAFDNIHILARAYLKMKDERAALIECLAILEERQITRSERA